MRNATIRDIEGALGTLASLLPGQDLQFEREGHKVRIIRPDHSRPFGATWRTKAETYDPIWFAVDALRLQKERSRLGNLTKRLRQVLNMTPDQYVESTRPTVELEEVPWTRSPNARTARLAAIEKIARELVLRDDTGRMIY